MLNFFYRSMWIGWKPIMWIFFFRSFLASANLPSAIGSLWRHHSSSQSSPLSKKPGSWSCEAFNRGTLIIKSVCFTSGRQFWPLVVVSRRTQGKNRFFSCNIMRTLTVDKPNIYTDHSLRCSWNSFFPGSVFRCCDVLSRCLWWEHCWSCMEASQLWTSSV